MANKLGSRFVYKRSCKFS